MESTSPNARTVNERSEREKVRQSGLRHRDALGRGWPRCEINPLCHYELSASGVRNLLHDACRVIPAVYAGGVEADGSGKTRPARTTVRERYSPLT